MKIVQGQDSGRVTRRQEDRLDSARRAELAPATAPARRASAHPAADLLPAPTPEEHERLRADIKEHGLRVPIVLTPDGAILDGRSRARACDELGIAYGTRVASMAEMLDPTAFVLSMNAARRHLSADQVTAIYMQASVAQVEADQREARAAQQAGLKQGTARGVHVAPTGKTAAKIAKAAGVSESTVKRVQRALKVAPERMAEVAQGVTSVAEILKQEIPAAVQQIQPSERAIPPVRRRGIMKSKPLEQAVSLLKSLEADIGLFEEFIVPAVPKPWPDDWRKRLGAAKNHIDGLMLAHHAAEPSEQATAEKPMPRRTEKTYHQGGQRKPISVSVLINKALGRIVGGLDDLGMFLIDGWEDRDFDQWTERMAASHAKLGAVLDLMRQPTCPTRLELEAILGMDAAGDLMDEAAGTSEAAP